MSTLSRAALIVSGGILASRVLGFVREMAIAALLGRTVEADLYQAAFTIPDYLFFLMAGGYLTITFVPIVSRHLAAGNPEEANRCLTAILRVVGGLMAVLTVATMLAARPLTEWLFSSMPADQIPELVGLMRIILPAQFFFVVGSLLMAVQYAHRKFVIPTLAPLIYNVAIIAGGLVAWATDRPGPAGFMWGALVGAAVGNFALQWWGARQVGARLQQGVPLLHESVPEYMTLAFPLMIGQSAVALDEVFLRIFGQLGGVGDISGLNYARRLNMVPIGVIAQAAGVASYPFLARLFAEGRIDDLRATVARTLRTSLAVAGLATAVTVGLATPLIRVAYERGGFTAEDTAAVAPLLATYGVSIPLWAAHQVYTRGFYAQRRMWLPVAIGTVTTIVAIPMYLYGARTLASAGVAWASVGVMVIYTFAMAWWWHRETPVGEVAASSARMIVAALPAAAAAWGVTMLTGDASFVSSLAAVVLGGIAATAVYWATLRLMGAPELAMLDRRRRPTGDLPDDQEG